MTPSESDRKVLDLYADNIRLQLENDELRFRVSRLESEVEALQGALELSLREK